MMYKLTTVTNAKAFLLIASLFLARRNPNHEINRWIHIGSLEGIEFGRQLVDKPSATPLAIIMPEVLLNL